MVELRHGLGFAEELLLELSVGVAVLQDLDRHGPLQREVETAVDDGESALADLPLDLVLVVQHLIDHGDPPVSP